MLRLVLGEGEDRFSLAYYQYDVALINLLSVCGTPEQSSTNTRQGKTEELWELKIEN